MSRPAGSSPSRRTVGVNRGAPFIDQGRTGILVDGLSLAHLPEIAAAVERLHDWDREEVRAHALIKFDTQAILATIETALEKARRS